jgi:serine/threonine protein kinase HipA of HipAB toxin-antitoxin module
MYHDFYILQRNRYGANFKIGVQEFDKKKISLDTSVGVGLVYQISKESDRSNYNDKPVQANRPFLKVGNQVLPTLSVGIKIGLKN